MTKWITGKRPVTDGIYNYLIAIRSPADPKRKPRAKGGQEDRTPHLTFAKMPMKSIRKELIKCMADGKPRTLNHIGVELWDKTADVTLNTKVEEALWRLVEEEHLEFTMGSPVLFRLLS